MPHREVFLAKRYGNFRRGPLPNGDVECSGYEEIAIFGQHLPLS